MDNKIIDYLNEEGLRELIGWTDEASKEWGKSFEDLTIEDVESAFDEMDNSDPSYSTFFDVINKAKEAAALANNNATAASDATKKANDAANKADSAADYANTSADNANEIISSINDMTTGENLLRGTRDFRQGTERIQNVVANRYTDGWLFNSPNVTSRYVNDRGFTVLHYKQSGLSSDAFAYSDTCVYKPEVNTVYTLSMKFMADSSVSYSNTTVAQLYLLDISGSTLWSDTGITFSKCTDETLTFDKWFNLKYNFTLPTVSASEYYLLVRIGLPRNGSIHFCELMLQPGKINHPIYIPNPNDIDYINDLTTGINLLKGTRDFQIGKERWENQNICTDGFYNQGDFTFSKESSGFVVASLNKTNAASDYLSLRSSVITDIPKDRKITVSFEFMTKDKSKLSSDRICLIQPSSEPGKIIETKIIRIYESTSHTISSIQSNEWYKAKYSYLVPETAKSLIVLLVLFGDGDINFRKLMVQPGDINNPEWSPSPFDYASSNEWNESYSDGIYARSIVMNNNLQLTITPNSVIRGAYLVFGMCNTGGPFAFIVGGGTNANNCVLTNIASHAGHTFSASGNTSTGSVTISCTQPTWSTWKIIGSVPFTLTSGSPAS